MPNSPQPHDSHSPACAGCPLVNRPIEAGCPHDAAEQPIAGRSCVSFSSGDRLFDEGDPIAGVYCMHSGAAGLVKRNGEKELVVGVVPPGDLLGMPDILSSDHHRNGAMALHDISACFIPTDEMRALLKNDPSIMFRAMQKMCDRIKAMERHLEK